MGWKNQTIPKYGILNYNDQLNRFDGDEKEQICTYSRASGFGHTIYGNNREITTYGLLKMAQAKRPFSFFSFVSNNFYIRKLQTSAGFKIGSSLCKASTMTTRPSQQPTTEGIDLIREY